MRKVHYLTQHEIDELVLKTSVCCGDYYNTRRFQDGEIDELKTATDIYIRIKEDAKDKDQFEGKLWSVIFEEINADLWCMKTKRLCRAIDNIRDAVIKYYEENYFMFKKP
jgi:hypothetical protein